MGGPMSDTGTSEPRQVVYCQGCGARRLLPSLGASVLVCGCGARWWSAYTPTGRKMALAQEFSTRRGLLGTPSDDSCRCNEQAREIGGEALRRVEAEQGRLDDARRES